MKNLAPFKHVVYTAFFCASLFVNSYSQNYTEYLGLNWGGNTGNAYSLEHPNPACADINNDGLMDVVLGDLEGGLSYIRQSTFPGGNAGYQFLQILQQMFLICLSVT